MHAPALGLDFAEKSYSNRKQVLGLVFNVLEGKNVNLKVVERGSAVVGRLEQQS